MSKSVSNTIFAIFLLALIGISVLFVKILEEKNAYFQTIVYQGEQIYELRGIITSQDIQFREYQNAFLTQTAELHKCDLSYKEVSLDYVKLANEIDSFTKQVNETPVLEEQVVEIEESSWGQDLIDEGKIKAERVKGWYTNLEFF